MRKNEIINKINELYSTELERNILVQYTNDNLDRLNKYKSLYPVIGESGNIFLKYIPTNEEYMEFEDKNRNYMNTEAIKFNRNKYGIS